MDLPNVVIVINGINRELYELILVLLSGTEISVTCTQ